MRFLSSPFFKIKNENKVKKDLTQRVEEYLLANCNEKKNAIGMIALASLMETSTRSIRLSVRELRRENPFGKKHFLVSDFQIPYTIIQYVDNLVYKIHPRLYDTTIQFVYR